MKSKFVFEYNMYKEVFNFNQLDFVIMKFSVFFEVRVASLITIKTSFCFKVLIINFCFASLITLLFLNRRGVITCF
jgi:hypothetical protein